ncbi:MAG: DUF4340 domain-containing protein [Bacteroidales bacterium]|nr:DUF4340 domain-containing protein [Bacteroidales bacterium]
MNFRLTAIFFIVMVVLVTALMVAVWTEEDATHAGTGTGLVPALTSAGLKPSDVDTVTITRSGAEEGELLFVKEGNKQWRLEKPVPAKVDSFLVDNLIRDLFRAEPIEYAGRTDNPAIHGLQEPGIRITLKSGADHAATVAIGDTTIGDRDAVTFIATGERPNRPLAVRRSDLAGLFASTDVKDGPAAKLVRGLSGFRLRKPLGAGIRDAVTEVQSLKLSTNGKELALTRLSGGIWNFTAPANLGEADTAGDTAPNAQAYTGVRPLLNALTNLSVTTDGFIEQPGELAQYGLAADDPAVVRIELQPSTGPAEILFLGKAVEQDGKPVNPPQIYARLDGDSAVMKIPFDRMAALKQTITDPRDLRNKDLFASGFRERIDSLDLTVGGSTIHLRKVPVPDGPESQWVLYGGPHDPQVADQTDVEALLTALTRPRLAVDILPTHNDAAFVEPERKATIKLWANGFEKTPTREPGKIPPEPKPLGTPIELLFGKRDADTVFVRRTDLKGITDFKLPDSLVSLATRNRLDYVSARFQSFLADNAVKLRFNRGSAVFELEKASTPDPLYPNGKWTFTAPAAQKGQLADTSKLQDLLGVASRISPHRVIAEQPTTDELKAWGLDPAAPRMKVDVSLQSGDPKEQSYLLGNETDDKGYVYARQGTGPVVTVPRVAFDRLTQEDITDKALFRLNPTQVKMLKLRGWKALTGTPLTYQFHKIEGTWQPDTPPTPAGFVVHPDKLNALIQTLAAPKIISVLGPSKPEHGTSADQNAEALEITIEQEGEPALTLILGAKVGTDEVYATSTTRPGETVTLNPAEIRKFTDKPASLQK